MSETPSIASAIKRQSKLGTILTIEPNMVEIDGERRRYVLVHEENIVVTIKMRDCSRGGRPQSMPIIQLPAAQIVNADKPKRTSTCCFGPSKLI
jgi:hypothetical protein